jgi:hypothetical protein
VFLNDCAGLALGGLDISACILAHGKPPVTISHRNTGVKCLLGTLKAALTHYTILDWSHLVKSMASFQVWYNLARVHQHLHRRTPQEAWDGADPLRKRPTHASVMRAWGGHLCGVVLLR